MYPLPCFFLPVQIRYHLDSVGGCEHSNADDWNIPISVDPSRLYHTLSNISPYTVYVVRLHAVTDAGKGQFAEIYAQTLSIGNIRNIW